MPFVADLKKELKGKDVVFMYFANNSSIPTWENIIKEYSLTQQQDMLEAGLSVNSFPTHVLIDRQDNVINMEAPGPSDRVTLVETIKRML
jgi:hypothetical protein